MLLVLDTNVVVSALLWIGAPRQLLNAARRSGPDLYTSAALLAELTDILTRAKFQTKIAASQLSADELVELYAELAFPVRPIEVPRLTPDPDDDVVIGTALSAKADFIVTGDRTLLSVMEYNGGRIISVAEALDAILHDRSKNLKTP